MGIFRQKNTLPRSEAAMLAASDLGPIHVHLDQYRLTFEDCMWTPEYDAPEMPEGAGSIEQEICKLRREKRRMKKELDRFMVQAKEMKELKERWNLLDFKYQLLLDMWTMRALDQKKEEACGGSKRRPHSTGGMSPSREGSPRRCSPKRTSPKRNGRHESPPRNRHHFSSPSKHGRHKYEKSGDKEKQIGANNFEINIRRNHQPVSTSSSVKQVVRFVSQILSCPPQYCYAVAYLLGYLIRNLSKSVKSDFIKHMRMECPGDMVDRDSGRSALICSESHYSLLKELRNNISLHRA